MAVGGIEADQHGAAGMGTSDAVAVPADLRLPCLAHLAFPSTAGQIRIDPPQVEEGELVVGLEGAPRLQQFWMSLHRRLALATFRP